jgi:hypothetical protein
MQVLTIADAVVADTNTDYELPVDSYDQHPEAFLQVEISGTFTVQILGKLHADASYVELVAAATANYIQPVAIMPYLRVTTSGGASTPICSVYCMLGKSPRV